MPFKKVEPKSATATKPKPAAKGGKPKDKAADNGKGTLRKPGAGGKAATLSWNDAVKGMDKRWKKSRKEAPKGGGFADDASKIDDGSYVCKVSVARAGAWPDKSKKNNGEPIPFVEFRLVVALGEFRGSRLTALITWRGEDDSKAMSDDNFKRAVEACGYQYDTLDAKDFPDLLADITKDHPLVHIAKKTKPPKKQGGEPFVSIYFNRAASDSELAQLEDEGEPEEEDEEDDTGDDD